MALTYVNIAHHVYISLATQEFMPDCGLCITAVHNAYVVVTITDGTASYL